MDNDVVHATLGVCNFPTLARVATSAARVVHANFVVVVCVYVRVDIFSPKRTRERFSAGRENDVNNAKRTAASGVRKQIW